MPLGFDNQGAYIHFGSDLYVWRRPFLQAILKINGKRQHVCTEIWDYSPESFNGSTGISAEGLIAILAMISSVDGAELPTSALHALGRLDIGLVRGEGRKFKVAPDTILALMPRWASPYRDRDVGLRFSTRAGAEARL